MCASSGVVGSRSIQTFMKNDCTASSRVSNTSLVSNVRANSCNTGRNAIRVIECSLPGVSPTFSNHIRCSSSGSAMNVVTSLWGIPACIPMPARKTACSRVCGGGRCACTGAFRRRDMLLIIATHAHTYITKCCVYKYSFVHY